ncbi:hypothetical protein [Bacteroides propionicifaciens]|uniref:hypothetical protein n=1 Tax=Bacteroides propionicifaciens TaxID=392838 RepID=UPI00039A3360|nr:hypothetical protein [Bacteroides propionicifaciens]
MMNDILTKYNTFNLFTGLFKERIVDTGILLKHGYYNFVGTDTHRSKWLQRCTARLELRRSMTSALIPLLKNNKTLITGEWMSF